MSDVCFAFRTEAPLGAEGPEANVMWEHGCRGLLEEGPLLIGYFDRVVSLPLEGNWEELGDEDYLERYYLELDCVAVGPLVIAPTHRSASLRAGQKPLWIDPGMAFGTGHHETTRLALEALALLDLSWQRVLDLGSGSGILAIAADLLGAGAALGLDTDGETLAIARENAALNRSRAVFEHRSLTPTDRVDVLVANLYAELHVELARAYRQVLAPGGRLIVTGILGDRAAMVEEALTEDFEQGEWHAAGEWRLFRAVRRDSRS